MQSGHQYRSAEIVRKHCSDVWPRWATHVLQTLDEVGGAEGKPAAGGAVGGVT